MKIKEIKEIEYSGPIYTPQVADNENYLFENGCLSKNCQNFSPSTMVKVLSRIGKNCKVILMGSQRQIDSKYVTKWNNGLAVVMNYGAKPDFQTDVTMSMIELKKVVRSNMAEFAERLFE